MPHWHPFPPSVLAARSVGLFGGSFNPAHDGHRHIAETALARLGLDEIWWMVSPQNPLKSGSEMMPLVERLRSASAVADHPAMRVTDIETSLGSTYTAETLNQILAMYPRHRFVWLMGADNLIQIPKWKDWSKIFNTVPIAVFARPTYSVGALSGVAANRFARRRVSEIHARTLARSETPAWTFVHCRLHAASATAIRAGMSTPPGADLPGRS